MTTRILGERQQQAAPAAAQHPPCPSCGEPEYRVCGLQMMGPPLRRCAACDYPARPAPDCPHCGSGDTEELTPTPAPDVVDFVRKCRGCRMAYGRARDLTTGERRAVAAALDRLKRSGALISYGIGGSWAEVVAPPPGAAP